MCVCVCVPIGSSVAPLSLQCRGLLGLSARCRPNLRQIVFFSPLDLYHTSPDSSKRHFTSKT